MAPLKLEDMRGKGDKFFLDRARKQKEAAAAKEAEAEKALAKRVADVLAAGDDAVAARMAENAKASEAIGAQVAEWMEQRRQGNQKARDLQAKRAAMIEENRRLRDAGKSPAAKALDQKIGG